MPQAVVRLLLRLSPDGLGPHDWLSLFAITADGTALRVLSHLPTITNTLVRQFMLVPAAFRHPSLLGVLNHLPLRQRTWRIVTDALLALSQSERTTVLRQARRVGTVADFWDLCFTCLGLLRVIFGASDRTPIRIITEHS